MALRRRADDGPATCRLPATVGAAHALDDAPCSRSWSSGPAAAMVIVVDPVPVAGQTTSTTWPGWGPIGFIVGCLVVIVGVARVGAVAEARARRSSCPSVVVGFAAAPWLWGCWLLRSRSPSSRGLGRRRQAVDGRRGPMSFLERVDQTIRRSPVWRSFFRQPYPRDERSRAYAVMNNVFLHIHPVRVRQHAVKFAYTFCLGGLTFFLFLVLTVTGVYLMVFYVPAATMAYNNILEIQSQVTFGLLTRNIHRWARPPDGVLRVPAHDAGLLPRRLQAAARVQLGRRRRAPVPDHHAVASRATSCRGTRSPTGPSPSARTSGRTSRSWRPRSTASCSAAWRSGRTRCCASTWPTSWCCRWWPRLPGGPLLADPQGRRHLRAALSASRRRTRGHPCQIATRSRSISELTLRTRRRRRGAGDGAPASPGHRARPRSAAATSD